MKNSESSIFDKSWEKNPYLEKNNRGSYHHNKSYIRYGFPQPPSGRKEYLEDMKGSDYIGPQIIKITPNMVGKKIAVFKGIEIKCIGDTLSQGQIKFHNWLIGIGGLSEIHIEQKDSSIKIIRGEI